MKILLVNDDGYNTIGINILREKCQKYGEVYVVAPTSHQSGMSMAFSISKGFHINKYKAKEMSIDGSPVDCCLLAFHILKNHKFDLVISGVNNGLNISYDTLYSGTIGAALEALNHGIPSIALSTDIGHFDIVKDELENVLDFVIKNKLYSKDYCLNINFPKGRKIKAYKFTHEHFKKDEYYTWNEEDGLHVDRHENFKTIDINSDVYAVTHDILSICPIRPSYQDDKTLMKLRNKKLKRNFRS